MAAKDAENAKMTSLGALGVKRLTAFAMVLRSGKSIPPYLTPSF